MKASREIKRLLITAAIVAAGILACTLVYIWFDEVLNGYLLDWFALNYMEYEPKGMPDGSLSYYRVVRWDKVKGLVFGVLLLVVTVWIISVRLFSILYASWYEKKMIRRAGQMIGTYMRQNKDVADVFPEEYAEISVQLADIKSNMQRHEQIVKEEAARKNDLITYLAHDLKTPLTSVVGYLSLLEEAPDMPPKQKAKYVHIALDKALRLEKLINEFFEITRYNLQQIVLERESVDLEFMLVQMADEFYPILQEHGNAVRLFFEGEESGSAARQTASLQVYADSEKLARVFNNILKNAVAYSYPDTEIRIDCHKEGDRVLISFSNHGKTIPRQRLDAVFEKFFRLDDARATNSGGAGLGLAIAREIVSLHGGAITATSEDEITVFTVELPAG